MFWGSRIILEHSNKNMIYKKASVFSKFHLHCCFLYWCCLHCLFCLCFLRCCICVLQRPHPTFWYIFKTSPFSSVTFSTFGTTTPCCQGSTFARSCCPDCGSSSCCLQPTLYSLPALKIFVEIQSCILMHKLLATTGTLYVVMYYARPSSCPLFEFSVIVLF